MAQLPPCDVVLGIGSGGTVPASIIAYQLGVPLRIDWFSYRGPDNSPVHDTPRLLRGSHLPCGTRHVLLVDDVSVSGRTLKAAAKRFADLQVTTLVLKGHADIVLMPHLDTCVRWPWHYCCSSDHHEHGP